MKARQVFDREHIGRRSEEFYRGHEQAARMASEASDKYALILEEHEKY